MIFCAASLLAAQNSIRLDSGCIAIDWTEQEDGWHISSLSVNGKLIAHPAGYYTVLYLNRRPAQGLVFQDIEGTDFTFFPSVAIQLPDGSVKFKKELRFGTVEAVWSIDPVYRNDVCVEMKLNQTARGSISLSSPTLAIFEKDEIAWGMIPGNWYGTEVQYDVRLATSYSQGIPCVPTLANEKNSGTLCPLITTNDRLTMAVIPEPGTESNQVRDSVRVRECLVGMSLMNRHDEFSPVIYHPILGQVQSLNDAGTTTEFRFRYTVSFDSWFDVFQHAVNDVYDLPSLLTLQTNGMSLSERLSRLQKFLRKGKEAGWRTWTCDGVIIGANGTKIADAGTMYMMAYNGDDAVIRSRLEYVRNYKIIQQETKPGFFCGAALGEYANEDGVESERGNWIEPIHTTYYTMVDFGNMLLFNPDDSVLLDKLRMAGDRLLSWQKPDGSFEVGYDRFSYRSAFPDLTDYRPTWYGLLIAYKHLKDPKYLDAARRGADWQKKMGVDRGFYLGVCGDARNVWDFCTAQTAQAYLDLFESTGEESYKTAAIEAARVYATSIFTHPKASCEVKHVAGVPYEDWQVNQTGLGVEHIRGTAGGGPILISSYAGLFLRIFEWTKDPVFEVMARAAARGRNLFVEQESGCAIYYWSSMDNVKKGSTVFPWHAYWQFGWITDYLLSECRVRSGGKISFPYGYMTPKVGPHVTYGFAPGDIYGRKADLVFRPDMISCDNADVEFVSALSADGKRYFLMALSQSPASQGCTVSINPSLLTGRKTAFKRVSCLTGQMKKAGADKNSVSLDFQPWGLAVLEFTLK